MGLASLPRPWLGKGVELTGITLINVDAFRLSDS